MSNPRAHEEFDVVSDVYGDDGKRRPCCRAVCDSCGAVARHWITGRFAPQLVAKGFERDGWDFSRGKTCPSCMSARREAARKNPKPSLRSANMTVVPIKEALAPRALTPDEKTKARGKLEGCFDEQRGVYLDGMSDQKIGEQLGLPWASVRDYREVAFGPLKGNEETAALKADIDKLSADLAALMSRSSKEIGEIASAKDKLLTRLNALEKKLGFA